MPPYTHKQGQYVAFIYYYTKLNRRPPAEADMHAALLWRHPADGTQMILKLEELGFISRIPGQSRSIGVLLSPEQLPPLE